MASVTYSTGTVIGAVWLNDVNAVVWGILNGATTAVAARTALGVYSTAQVYTKAEVDSAISSSPDAVLKTLIDVKGDLIVGMASDIVARKAVGSDGNSLMSDSTQSDGLVWAPNFLPSLAPNPFFMVDQRVNSATSRADDTYASDRWYVLTQSNPITVTTQTDQENGQPFNARLIQSNAAAQRLGYATIIEGKNCKHLRGQQVTFRPRIRISNSQVVRIAVLEWTGTEDAVTSDIVLDWTSSIYTANNFFLAANLTISGIGSKTPSAATWADMDTLTVTLGSSFNNIILFIWVEQTAAQNVTFDIGKVRFVRGTFASEILLPVFTDELNRCQRYFWKTFNYQIAPAGGAGNNGAISYYVSTAGVANIQFIVPCPQMMRIDPTVTPFNTAGGASTKWRNFTDSADSGTAAFSAYRERINITNPQVAGDGIGEFVALQFTVDAEL